MVDKMKKKKIEKAENYLATEKAEASMKRLEKEVKKLKKVNFILVGRKKFFLFFLI